MDSLFAATDTLAPWIWGATCLFARVMSLLFIVPIFGMASMPPRSRVVFGLVLAAAMDAGLGLIAVPLPAGPFSAILLILREVTLGAALGLAIRLLLAAVEAAGAVAAINMGLALNVLMNASTGEQDVALGRLLSLGAMLMFFALGGHLVMVAALFEHLDRFPPGTMEFAVPALSDIADAGAWMCRTAVVIAAPVLVMTLILNVLMGFIMRVSPSLNIFGIGLGIMILGGLVAIGDQGEHLLVWLGREVELLPERMFVLSGGG